MNSKTIEHGDHIFVPSSGASSLHAIYIGDDRVIYLEDKTRVVTETSLSQFIGTRPLRIRRVDPCDLPDTIVRRAKSLLQKRVSPTALKTPQQFAVFCQCGKPDCMQICLWFARVTGSRRIPIRQTDSGCSKLVSAKAVRRRA